MFVKWTLLIVFLTYAIFWGWEILSVCGGCLIHMTIFALTEDGTLQWHLTSKVSPSPLKWIVAVQNITSSLELVRTWNAIVLGIWVPWCPSRLRMGPSFPKQHHSWSLVLTLHIRCGRPHASQYLCASHNKCRRNKR